MTVAIPSFDALPVVGIDDDMQTVIQMRQKLTASFMMLGQILNAPSGVSADLKLKLNSVLFHLTSGLSYIDDYLHSGYSSDDMAGEVPNLMDSIKSHIDALRLAKPSWDNWLKTAKPPEAPAPLVSNGNSIEASGAPAVTSGDAIGFTAPTPLSTYLAIGGIAVGAFILWKILD